MVTVDTLVLPKQPKEQPIILFSYSTRAVCLRDTFAAFPRILCSSLLEQTNLLICLFLSLMYLDCRMYHPEVRLLGISTR